MNARQLNTTDQVLTDNVEGMSYLNRLPRRIVMLYLPMAVFVFVLLFPFYWMAITAVKPNSQLTDYNNYSPFWVVGPTLDHIKYLFFETSYPGWLWNTMLVAVGSTALSLAGIGLWGLCDRTRALYRLAPGGAPDLSRLSGAALDPVHSAGFHRLQARHL